MRKNVLRISVGAVCLSVLLLCLRLQSCSNIISGNYESVPPGYAVIKINTGSSRAISDREIERMSYVFYFNGETNGTNSFQVQADSEVRITVDGYVDGERLVHHEEPPIVVHSGENVIRIVLSKSRDELPFGITWELNGGEILGDKKDKYFVNDSYVLPVPHKAGQTFSGWYTDGSFIASSKVTSIPLDTLGNLTFYARWADAVATVNGEGFEDISAAWAKAVAVADSSLVLLQDVGISSPLSMSSGKFTLDLNGKTLDAGGQFTVLSVSGGTLTIADTSPSGNGKITGGNGNSGPTREEGGGVAISGGATVNLTGGSITGNKAIKGGGIAILETGGGTLNMSGGSITGNRATNNNWCFGGGMSVLSGSLNISGGEITDNEVSFSNGGGGGGGVFVDPKTDVSFTMTGGLIARNKSAGEGGGVYLYGDSATCTFVMDGGEISGNTGSRGNGVTVNGKNTATYNGGTHQTD